MPIFCAGRSMCQLCSQLLCTIRQFGNSQTTKRHLLPQRIYLCFVLLDRCRLRLDCLGEFFVAGGVGLSLLCQHLLLFAHLTNRCIGCIHRFLQIQDPFAGRVAVYYDIQPEVLFAYRLCHKFLNLWHKNSRPQAAIKDNPGVRLYRDGLPSGSEEDLQCRIRAAAVQLLIRRSGSFV